MFSHVLSQNLRRKTISRVIRNHRSHTIPPTISNFTKRHNHQDKISTTLLKNKNTSFQSITTPLHTTSMSSPLHHVLSNNTKTNTDQTFIELIRTDHLNIDMKRCTQYLTLHLTTFLTTLCSVSPQYSPNVTINYQKILSQSLLSSFESRIPFTRLIDIPKQIFSQITHHHKKNNKKHHYAQYHGYHSTPFNSTTNPHHLFNLSLFNPRLLYFQPPAILAGWTLFGWGSGDKDQQAISSISNNQVKIQTQSQQQNVQRMNDDEPTKPFIAVPLRKVIRFEKSDPTEKLPPPIYNRNELDEYGISIHNVFRFCTDERLHQKFKVNYIPGDIHHNINEYRTFIEKERFYIQKDYNEILTLQNVYIRRLLQLHYLLGLKLEREKEYKEGYKAKVIEELLVKKKKLLDKKMSECPEDQHDQIYEQYQVKLTQDEIDAIDLDLFGDIRQSDLLPFHIRGGVIENDEAPLPPDPDNHTINLDETSAELLSEVLFPQETGELGQIDESLGMSKVVTNPKPKIFFQPTHGELELLPPHILKWLEKVRGAVLFSMKSAEELSQAVHSLNSTLGAFDSMVQDSLNIEEYKQEMNLLACQAAFITGTRQVLHNILKHSDEAMYKYEQFYTPSIQRYLASITFQPHLHTDPNQITPFHPHYYDEFTPKNVVEQIQLEKIVQEETSRQDFIQQHTNRLIHKNRQSTKSWKEPSPQLLKAHGEIFMTKEDHEALNERYGGNQNALKSAQLQDSTHTDPQSSSSTTTTTKSTTTGPINELPLPPLLAIEEPKVHTAVKSFANDMTPDYSPISYPFKPIQHKWTDQIDIDDVNHQINSRLIIPSRAIPPPRDYTPRPAELPVMSGIESNIPEKYKDSPFFGWKEDILAYKQRLNEDKAAKLAQEGSEFERNSYQARKYNERLMTPALPSHDPAREDILGEFEKNNQFSYEDDNNNDYDYGYDQSYNTKSLFDEQQQQHQLQQSNQFPKLSYITDPIPRSGSDDVDDDDDDDDDVDMDALLFNNPRSAHFIPPNPLDQNNSSSTRMRPVSQRM